MSCGLVLIAEQAREGWDVYLLDEYTYEYHKTSLMDQIIDLDRRRRVEKPVIRSKIHKILNEAFKLCKDGYEDEAKEFFEYAKYFGDGPGC